MLRAVFDIRGIPCRGRAASTGGSHYVRLELADAIRAARSDTTDTADVALTRIATAYVDFARDHPAVYDAMFTRATSLHFAAQDTPPQLREAFAELRQAVSVAVENDADALTEVFWAGLHGLVTLNRAGRLRPGYDSDRVHLLVEQFARG